MGSPLIGCAQGGMGVGIGMGMGSNMGGGAPQPVGMKVAHCWAAVMEAMTVRAGLGVEEAVGRQRLALGAAWSSWLAVFKSGMLVCCEHLPYGARVRLFLEDGTLYDLLQVETGHANSPLGLYSLADAVQWLVEVRVQKHMVCVLCTPCNAIKSFWVAGMLSRPGLWVMLFEDDSMPTAAGVKGARQAHTLKEHPKAEAEERNQPISC
eukprot:1160166-Pelagomonas_calceolata.AAC.6